MEEDAKAQALEEQAVDTPGTPVGSLPGEHPDAARQRTAAEPSSEPGKRRRLLYVTLPGCWGALIAGCLSFTPSLLPRGGITQGVIWGITAAIGYGLGVAGAWIWRAFADRAPQASRHWSWPVFFVSVVDTGTHPVKAPCEFAH